MYRRDLLQKLLTVIPSSILLLKARAIGETIIEPPPIHELKISISDDIQSEYGFSYGVDEFLYKGFRVWWTGWKQAIDNGYVAGQWLAYPNTPELRAKEIFISSSAPGYSGPYVKGGNFNLAQRPWQVLFHSEKDFPEIAASEKAKARYILLMEIDSYYKGSSFTKCVFRYKPIASDGPLRVQTLKEADVQDILNYRWNHGRELFKPIYL